MGIALPQVVTSDRASGAQVIDGSLKFDGTSNYLTRSFSAGNRRTWTWAAWVKRYKFGAANYGLFSYYPGSGNGSFIRFSDDDSGDTLRFYSDTNTRSIVSKEKFRDTGWYHIVIAVDTTQGTDTDRVKRYVNGVQQTTNASNTWPSASEELLFNQSGNHFLGKVQASAYGPVAMSQVYFIDGQALDASYFGYTDPLTNTWRPKKLEGVDLNGTTFNSKAIIHWTHTGGAVSAGVYNAAIGSVSTGGSYSGDTWTATNSAWVDTWDMGSADSFTLSSWSVGSYSDQTWYWSNDSSFASGVTGPNSGTIANGTYSTTVSGTKYRYLRVQNIPSATYSVVGNISHTGKLGTNGFYLPMDGNSPIGEDKSGNGNNWTPVNFGGSVALDNPQVSGARPILNTDGGGNVARPGVFGSEENVGYAVTVYDDGGGNKYYIDGTKQATLNGLIRGATYTFDTSDSTIGSTHPFRLSATSAHGTEYTDGVVAITGAATTITVPHNAPNSLYYYCTAHSGMGSSITGITTNASLADPYAWKNTLALPLVGSANDVSNSVNSGSTTKAVANTGVEFLSESSNFYNGSAKIFGTDKLNVTESNSDFTFGTSTDFTIECWTLKTSSTHYGRIIEIGTVNDNAFLVDGDGPDGTTSFRLRYDYTGSTAYSSYGIVLDKWHHVAAVRNSGTLTFYIDGIASGTVDLSSSNLPGGNAQIGNYLGSNLDYGGYIQDLRVYKGVAKYTSNFVVPATNPDILPDTPSGVSGSSKLAKVTDGAVSFDGAGDHLLLPANADFNFGSGDFTLEFFWYPTSTTRQGLYHGSFGADWSIGIDYSSTGGNKKLGFWASSNGSSWDIANADNGGNGITTGEPTQNAWNHIVYVRNGNTFAMYLNGKNIGSVTSSATISLTDTDTPVIGAWWNSETAMSDVHGFISNFRVLKGTALYTTDFTPPFRTLTNVTNTKLLCCQSNKSASIAAVTPGTITANGNAAATNFNPFNTDINTVRGQETGYCTWNPLSKANINLSDGNLTAIPGANDQSCFATLSIPDNGKVYFEFTCIQRGGGGAQSPIWGVGNPSGVTLALNPQNSGNNASTWLYGGDGNKTGGGSGSTSYGTAFIAGDIIGVCVDRSNSRIWFSKNNVWQNGGNPNNPTDSNAAFTNVTSTGTLIPFYGNNNGTYGYGSVNFGQKPFKFPPPDGFQPLNAANSRPETVITRPDHYVGIVTYTGDASTSRLITGLNFNDKPDLIWIKNRDESIDHTLYDSVRGFGANKELTPNDTYTEGETGTGKPNTDVWGYVNSNNFNGFTVNKGSNSTPSVVNSNGIDYVAWSWKAGGNKNTFNKDDVGYASAAAAGLTGGDITPVAASVGTKQGFSIIQYQGNGSTDQTIPHGLTQAPDFSIIKNMDGVANWTVFHRSATTTTQKVIYLNTTGAIADYSGGDSTWWGTLPGASVFTIGATSTAINNGTNDMISYHWHDVPGLQKFGSYEGNGNADGSFVELGFRPSMIIIRGIDNASRNWLIDDTTRNPYNGKVNTSTFSTNYATLAANSGSAEPQSGAATFEGNYIDFLSNGFKLRSSAGNSNGSETYIYAAWAEAPSFNLYGAQSNAR